MSSWALPVPLVISGGAADVVWVSGVKLSDSTDVLRDLPSPGGSSTSSRYSSPPPPPGTDPIPVRR